MPVDHYATEVAFLDSLVDFHPEWIEQLSAAQLETLDLYYGIVSEPQDLEMWRQQHTELDSGLEERAKDVIRSLPGLGDFGRGH